MVATSPTRKLDRLRRFWRSTGDPSPGRFPDPSPTISSTSSTAVLYPLPQRITPSTASTSASTATPGTFIGPAHSLNVPSLTQSFYDSVIRRLNDEERKAIEPYIDPTVQDVEPTIQKAYSAAFAKQQICKDKQWQWEFRGRVRVLRDEADKVLLWLNRFKVVGDAVASLNPVHIGLPWAGIKVLLEVVLSDQEQMTALLTGMAAALHMSHRLGAYLEYLQHLPTGSKFATLLEESLIELHAHVLKFLVKAICTYHNRIQSAVKQFVKSFWNKAELEEFESQCDKLVLRVQDDIAICDRKLAKQDREKAGRMKATLDSQLKSIQGMNDLLEDVHTKLNLSKLQMAEGAKYPSHADEYLAKCMDGTREQLTKQIETWIKDPHGKNIFWLCGMAGTGKSTICRTIAETCLMYQSQGELLTASFFFKRGAGDRSNATRFFSTLALQFAETDPSIRVSVARAVTTEPMISQAILRQQMQELLVKPFEERAKRLPLTVVILVDALDECECEDDISMIIALLRLLAKTNTVSMRIFLTSRPGIPIQHNFQKIPEKDLYEDVRLEYVQVDTIKQDISTYLNFHLEKIRNAAQLPLGWPSEEDIEILVDLACPLFIFAATMCRYISERVIGSHPRKRLESLLQQRKDKTLVGLDQMYEAILEQVFPQSDTHEYEDALEEFQQLLSPVVLLANPLPLGALSRLLNLPSTEVFSTLQQLQPVLQVSTSLTDTSPIQPLHASFADYLLRPNRNDKKFSVDKVRTHEILAKKCLQRLCKETCNASLKPNLCHASHPGTRRTDIPLEQVKQHITDDIEYSCCYWVHHTIACGNDVMLYDESDVHNFLVHHLLHWLEAMAWLGRLSSVIGDLNNLRSLTKSNRSMRLLTLLDDASRFLLQNRYVIDLAPLQLYSSALFFTPVRSIVRQTFKSYLRSMQNFKLLPQVTSDWSAIRQTLEGHTAALTDMALAPDGTKIVSGSKDCTVRLWDSRTGEQLLILEGHTDSVLGVAFCPADQMIVASCSTDKTIRFWNIKAGQEVQKLEEHEDAIGSISFSPDGKSIASVSGKSIIRLWNFQTGEKVRNLEGHNDLVNAISFAPCGGFIASASSDSTVRIWDVYTGQCVQKYDGHTGKVYALAFSPLDTNLLASAAQKGSILLWDIKTGKTLQKLERYHEPAYALAFHPTKENVLASSGSGGTIILWNFRTRNYLQTLEPSRSTTVAIAFSPVEGATLISASEDDTIRLMDVRLEEPPQDIKGIRGFQEVAFSADGERLLSASRLGIVGLWCTKTGDQMQSFEGHGDEVTAVAFASHSRDIIVSGSINGEVRLWEGKAIKIFKKHSRRIECVALSPDGNFLASQSEDMMCLKNIQSGEEIYRFEGGYRLCFSPDGDTIACGLMDCTIKVRSVPTGELVQTYRGHSGEIYGIDYSPDGKTLASRSSDLTTRLWNVETGKSSTLGTCRFGTQPSFSNDGACIRTDLGTFDIRSEDMPKRIPPKKDAALSFSGEWLQFCDKDILWLPVDYRTGPKAIHGNRYVVGQRNGTLSFFEHI